MINKQNIVSVLGVIFAAFIFLFGGPAAPVPINSQDMEVAQNFNQATTTVNEISRGNTSKKEVIFTFDGGSGIQSGEQILKVLAKHQVKGTFFLTGKMIEANPYLVRSIASGGHEIFSHTFNHLDLTTLSDAEIIEELNQTEKILQYTVGLSPRPYFRAPFGLYDVRVLTVAASQGYRSVFWTQDARDWNEIGGETAERVKERILTSLNPGTIYLMHIGDNITGAILDDVFTTIESRGYKIVSLTQGL